MPNIQLLPITPVNASVDAGKIQQMDPLLQRAIVLQRSGVEKRATVSTAEDEMAVLAKVTDVKKWINLSEVRSPVVLGDPDDQQQSIVTGRIPIKRIEHVRSQPFILSLKAARKILPALSATVEEIEAGRHLPAGMRAKGGKGAVVGIVDFGCDFAHANFLKPDRTTRVTKLWNQAGKRPGGDVGYGTLYTDREINQALTKPNPYNSLGYELENASHGTHVMDIAAGNGRGTGMPGVAPEAEIIFVELDGSDVPWAGPEIIGKNFGDSVQLLEALVFIFEAAGNKPCVINVSLGTNGGPHDGSSLVEQGIDRLIGQKPNRAVVIAASNSFADNIHAAGEIEGNKSYDIGWVFPGGDTTDNEMEVWYNGKGRLDVEIIDNTGKSLGVVPPGESGTVNDTNGNIILLAANRLDDPNNHENLINVFLNRGASGKWTIRLKNTNAEKVSFHAWIERDDRGQSFFAPPNNNTHTLGSISCGQNTIVAGSYDAHKHDVPLSWFSSAGPTRDGRSKPEISAPGHGVLAARSTSLNGAVVKSGTSMAAPAVTGSIAVLLAEAKSRGSDLSIEKIRDIVIKSARKKTGTSGWDDRYGFGRISVKDMVAMLPAAGSPVARPSKGTGVKKSTGLPKKAGPKKTAVKKKGGIKKGGVKKGPVKKSRKR